jgi:type I restriction enzyme S subunit
MFPTTFNDGIAAFLGLNNMDMEFIYYFLKSKTGWYLKEASRGQGQPNLNTDIISMTPFALPPFREQHRIATKIEQLMKLCDKLEKSIQQNQKYTQELLQVALKEALELE